MSKVVNAGNPVNLDHPLIKNRVAWWKVLRGGQFIGGPYLQDLIGITKGNRTLRGTLTGTGGTVPTWKPPGKYGQGALSFVRASSQYANIGSAILTATPLTIVSTFNSNDATNSQEAFGIAVAAGSTEYFRLNLNGAAGTVRAITGNSASGNVIATSANTWAANTWNFGAAVFGSASNRVAFLNGVAGTANTTTSTPTGLNTSAIGRLSGSVPANFMAGLIESVSVFNVALTTAQLISLWEEELAGCPTTLNWLPTKTWFLAGSGGVTTAFPGASVSLSIPRAVGVVNKVAPGRAVDLSIARAVGVSNLAGSGRAVDLSIVRAPGSIAVPMPGRAVDLTAARGSGGTKIAMPGFSIVLSIVAGGTLGTSTQTRAGISVSMSVPRAIGILKAGGTGVVKDLSIARAAAANLSTATGRTVCLTIARGVPVGGATTEARAGYSVGLTIARAVGIEVVPYTWTRTLLGGQAMRARAAYRLEVFDDEDFEIYGTIRSLATLAGARLQFHGYDSTGAVAWDSDAVPPTATVAVTDAAARTYDATSPPKEAGIYRWFITITNTGQVTEAVWGYLTVTKRNAPISSVLQDLLVGDYIR